MQSHSLGSHLKLLNLFHFTHPIRNQAFTPPMVHKFNQMGIINGRTTWSCVLYLYGDIHLFECTLKIVYKINPPSGIFQINPLQTSSNIYIIFTNRDLTNLVTLIFIHTLLRHGIYKNGYMSSWGIKSIICIQSFSYDWKDQNHLQNAFSSVIL